MDFEIIVFLVVSCLIIILGLLLNGFIVIVNLFWWMKHQTLQTVDVLITGLGLVRFMVLSISMCTICSLIFGWPLSQTITIDYISAVTMCLVFCSLWWGSLLCVFYCVKITNYSHRLFIRLKMNISKMVPRLLLISLVISFLSSLPCTWVVFSIHGVNGTDYGNATMKVDVVNLFIIVFAASIIPFMISCVSIYLIIVSLLRHSRNMSSRDSGFSDAQRDVHLSVIRSMISFLMMYVLYFAAQIMITSPIYNNPIFRSHCDIFMYAYPSLHSITFIASNRKLKTSFLAVLHCTWLGKIKHCQSKNEPN